MKWLTLIAAAYLLGSIPFGLLIARLHGIDLRRVGSGNIGATNVVRALGRKWGIICFLLDVSKGLLPMLIPPLTGLTGPSPSDRELLGWLAVGTAAILGHIFPVYLGFKGGKGVATSLGVVLGLWPYFTVCGLAALLVWLAAAVIWRYVSLASILAAAAYPLILLAAVCLLPGWTFANLWPLFLVAVPVPALVIWRHRANIQRIRAGTESRIGQKKHQPAA
ncbi:MAG TPA: glycerol-3-phosphate 1-O-acyltransferase PlsY [Anaerohalosphaeraceae bacterium]|nr:glycerol-3-phosphate 1-O-acyltransferase PlsY [Anaerohalosphaeraceae bacterium]